MRADLIRKWADTVELCENTFCRPEDALKIDGLVRGCEPSFLKDEDLYTFAVAVIEDAAVFAGDIVYHKDTSDALLVRQWHGAKWLSRNYSWIPF
jgi:hypothetical protein